MNSRYPTFFIKYIQIRKNVSVNMEMSKQAVSPLDCSENLHSENLNSAKLIL